MLHFWQHLQRPRFTPRSDEGDEQRLMLRAPVRSSLAARWLGRLAGVFGIILLVMFGALWMLQVRLAEGPIEVSQFMPQIAHNIESRIGAGYRVKMAAATIERTSYGATLAVRDVVLLSPNGQIIIAAPRADVAINVWLLPLGIVRPSHVEVYDIAVHLIVMPDGALSIATAAAADQNSDTLVSAPTAHLPTSKRSAHFIDNEVRQLLDHVFNPDGLIGGLEHVAVTHGSLYFDDLIARQTTRFDDLQLHYDHNVTTSTFDVAANGPNGRWQITAEGDTYTIGARHFSLAVHDLSLDELNIFMGNHESGIDFDMPISLSLSGEMSSEGALVAVKGALSIGAGFVFTRDPDQEPFWIDEASSHFVWNSTQHQIDVKDLQIFSDQTNLTYSGSVRTPDDSDAPWLIDLQAMPNAVIGPERLGETKLALNASHIKLRLFTEQQKLLIDEFSMNGPDINAQLSGEIGWATEHHHMRWQGEFTHVPVRVALMVWPSVSAAPVRNFMQQKLRGGMLERLTLAADLDETALSNMKYQLPPPDGSISVDFSISNTALTFIDHVPPLANMDAIGHVTGHTAQVKVGHAMIDLGNAKKMLINDGVFFVADTAIKPTPAHVTLHLTSSLDALGDFLARDGLKNFGGVQIDTANIKGQTDANVTIDMLLTRPDQDPHVQVQANANVTNFSIDHVLGKEKLDNGSLSVVYDNNALHATGQGHILGSPASIELNKPATTIITEASIAFGLDDAARSRLGLSLAGLNGPIAVHFVGALGQADKPTAQADIDFTKASFDGFLSSLNKSAVRPAKASFVVIGEGDHTHIDQLIFDAGNGLGVKGTMDIDENGGVSAAHLSQFKLSPSDEARLDFERGESALKIVMRGAAFDAHQFITRLTASDRKANEQDNPRDVDIDIKLNLLTGANRQNMTAVDLRYSRKANTTKTFSLNARQARSMVTGGLKRLDDGRDVLNINSGDGGAFLSFLDLYKRMEGGQLNLQAQLRDQSIDGTLTVSSFVVRDEPSLRRIVSEGQEKNANPQLNNINTQAAPFERLQINFSRSNGILTLRDAVMYGQQIGMNIDGKIDFARDAVALSGTFVPAYGINNLFSKIPLFGPVLMGGQHEGLFALNFRINGPASAPVLTVNPLSAIAPGFLRKIFGVLDGSLNNQLPAGSVDMPMSITPQPR